MEEVGIAVTRRALSSCTDDNEAEILIFNMDGVRRTLLRDGDRAVLLLVP